MHNRSVLRQEAIGVVSSYASAFHESEESELEVVTDRVRPACDPAVEEVLSAFDTASPEMPACGQDLELRHQPDEIFPLVFELKSAVDKGKITVNNSFDSFRPSFA